MTKSCSVVLCGWEFKASFVASVQRAYNGKRLSVSARHGRVSAFARALGWRGVVSVWYGAHRLDALSRRFAAQRRRQLRHLRRVR